MCILMTVVAGIGDGLAQMALYVRTGNIGPSCPFYFSSCCCCCCCVWSFNGVCVCRYGLVAALPPRYTGGVMIGNSISGTALVRVWLGD